MRVRKKPFLVMFLALLTLGAPMAGAPRKPARTDRVKAEEVSTGPAVMWNDPKDLKLRDLFYGPGGKEHAPKGVLTFVEEDREGTNPKFVVRDDEGGKWKVKLGLEARPETVCTRLVWAVGYYANEDYFVRDLKMAGMPSRLHRGQELVDAGGSVHNVRLKRESEPEDKKIGIWHWRHDAFTGTRELERAAGADGGDQQLGPQGRQQRHLPGWTGENLYGQRPGSQLRIGGTHLAFRERQGQPGILSYSPNSFAGSPPIPWISPFPHGLRGSFRWIRRK